MGFSNWFMDEKAIEKRWRSIKDDIPAPNAEGDVVEPQGKHSS
jgi:hypothetical protein